MTLAHACLTYLTKYSGAEPGILVWGPSCDTNIFIKTTLIYIYIYIYTHTRFFYYIYTYIHTFLFDKLYIYTHPKKKKKNLVFSIKVMFDDDLYKIKFIFFHFHSKILKMFRFKYKSSNFILK